MIRVGTGYDVHPLVAGRPLVLGGVRIPYALGLQGHSDADVLLHAVCDALLGAAALGDLGQLFPPGDPCYKDADSRDLLRTVVGLLRERGWRASNLDCTVIAERPRLAPYLGAMRDTLAGLLGLTREAVSVKATTTEGLGYIGKGEGIAAQAVVLIESAPAGG